MKGQVLGLFPPGCRAGLPSRKRTYRAALAAAYTGACVAPVAVAIGLLDPDALAGEIDTATRMMVSSVEAWLAGAAEAGVLGRG
jgi:asparagine synthase (glutamine-hydrolysing)